MARVNYLIAHLIHTDPKAARDQILEAFRAEKMHVGNAAKRIGCTHGTLLIWIAKLEMGPAVAKLKKLAEREGWHHENHGGRPRLKPAERKARALARKAA